MLRCVKKFFSYEAGAVTIEWVVLTAGVIALGIAGYSAFKNRYGLKYDYRRTSLKRWDIAYGRWWQRDHAFDQNRRTGVENVSRM